MLLEHTRVTRGIRNHPRYTPAMANNLGSAHIARRLLNNIQTNDFSSISTKELPLAPGVVAKATENAPKENFQEALGFAIMGRNAKLLVDILDRCRPLKEEDVFVLYPLHLATSYLDGATSCCQILQILGYYIDCAELDTRKLLVNTLGHTVLDNVMITILYN